jgi:phage terminase large subunit GpA-like protein
LNGETDASVDDRPEHQTQGFRLTGLNSPWLDWKRDLCEEFNEAYRVQQHGDEGLMKVFVNTRLAEPYRVLGKRVEVDLYAERRERYDCHEVEADVPDGVVLVTAAIDTHDHCLLYEIVGWGRGKESWGIEYGMIPGETRKGDSLVWGLIDMLTYNRVLKFKDGAIIRPRIIFVDSGGHSTTAVYGYAARRHPRVFAIMPCFTASP